MSLIGKPYGYKRTKFCFVYCGPHHCDCGANDPACADSIYYQGDLPKPPIEEVKSKEEKDGEV